MLPQPYDETANISSPLYSDVHEWLSVGITDHEVVYLVFISFVGSTRSPVDKCEECHLNDEVVNCSEFHQSRSILINGAATLSSHGSFVVGYLFQPYHSHPPIIIVISCLGISSNSIRNWSVFSFLYRCYLWTHWSVSLTAWSWWVCRWQVSTPSSISLYPSREWRPHPPGVSCHLFLNITPSPLY